MADSSLVTGDSSTEQVIANNGLTISTDIYEAMAFVEAIKAKHIDIPEETLAMGIYGYLSEIHANIIENMAVAAAEYANEAVPTRAQFERNVICHAISLGIDNIRATPAEMEVYICLPIERLIANMRNDMFILDKDFDIPISNSSTGTSYNYRLDYNVLVRRVLVPSGEYVYTAEYLLDDENEISDITNPYLPKIGTTVTSNTEFILIRAKIRQTDHYTIYKKIISSNPLDSKSITFTFPDQLAYFYVEAVEGDTTHHLKCIYDGLYDDTSGEEYCNYMYIDESTIRITFNRDSYQPANNADITIHVYTTKGSECNFDYTASKVIDLKSSNFSYDNIYMVLDPITSSEYGIDKKSVDELRRMIPKQMLLRDSVTTYTDLDNYFNQLNSEDIRLYFLQKIHNQNERIYFCYLLLKDNNNVVPTNTLDVKFGQDMFTNINSTSFILPAGSVFYYDGESDNAEGIVSSTLDEEKIGAYDKNGFLYINPFLVVISKNPFLVNYYCNILDYGKTVNFDYINQDCPLQFICEEQVSVRRPFYPKEDRNKYTIRVTVEQNIANDYNLIGTNEDGDIVRQDIEMYGIVYKESAPYRYCKATLVDYDDQNYMYTFDFTFTSNDIIDSNGNIVIDSGMYALGGKVETITYLAANVSFKFFVVAKLDEEYGLNDLDKYIPELEEMSLCNTYEINTGLDTYYDYTDVMESFVNITNNKTTSAFDYSIKRMPLVRYTYLNTQERVSDFISLMDLRKRYIETVLVLLEDSFGIDYKFFNTYGPSKLYNVNNESLLDRVNMSLKFEVKFENATDTNATNDITTFIKQYVENLNYITDLHMPNLITAVTNKFNTQLVYFKFVGLNDYESLHQSIYKQPTDEDDFMDSSTVPEFLNINTLENDTPDITYTVYDDKNGVIYNK